MSADENNNNIAIPTGGGGVAGVSYDASIEAVAMRVMQETGASSLVVHLAPDNDPSAVKTFVLDRAGNFRIVDDANEADSANN